MKNFVLKVEFNFKIRLRNEKPMASVSSSWVNFTITRNLSIINCSRNSNSFKAICFFFLAYSKIEIKKQAVFFCCLVACIDFFPTVCCLRSISELFSFLGQSGCFAFRISLSRKKVCKVQFRSSYTWSTSIKKSEHT